MASLFSLKLDDNGILRMPFNSADYGKANDIERACHKCNQSYPQGTMKELIVAPDRAEAYHDDYKLYRHSIFFCESCWYSDEISNAGNWTA